MKMKQSIFLIIVLAGSLILNLDAYYFCKKSVIEKNCKIPCNYNICSNDENACNHLNKFKNLTKHGLRRFHNKVKFVYGIEECHLNDYSILKRPKKHQHLHRIFIG